MKALKAGSSSSARAMAITVPYRAIAQAINVVVFIERTATGRKVREVSRLVGREGETYRFETLG
jgi:Flp pilus assembly CpaF family ATPase